MGLQETKIESLPFVTGELNYLAPTTGKPRTYAFDPPPGEPRIDQSARAPPGPDFRCRADRRQFSRSIAKGLRLVRHPTFVQEFLRR